MYLIHRIIGLVLGLALYWYGKKDEKRIKFLWLAYHLLGSGKSRKIPAQYAKDWNSNWVQYDYHTDKYLIRPYGSELFWLVGSMWVEKKDGKVFGKDVYNFAKQNGQRVIHGNDKTLQWAYSGGEGDSTRIPEKYTKVLYTLAKIIGLESEFKIENNRLLVSNNLWNRLGGKAFESVLEYPV